MGLRYLLACILLLSASCGSAVDPLGLGFRAGPNDDLDVVPTSARRLYLSEPTQKQLDELYRFTELRSLEVSGNSNASRPTGSIGALTTLTNLEFASMGNMRTEDLACLVTLTNLTSLRLDGCISVTTEFLDYLPDEVRLETLDICECPHIDGTIFNYLSKLTHLRSLKICDTSITMDEARQLQELLPDCYIDVLDPDRWPLG